MVTIDEETAHKIFLFPVALRPNAGYGLILEIF